MKKTSTARGGKTAADTPTMHPALPSAGFLFTMVGHADFTSAFHRRPVRLRHAPGDGLQANLHELSQVIALMLSLLVPKYQKQSKSFANKPFLTQVLTKAPFLSISVKTWKQWHVGFKHRLASNRPCFTRACCQGFLVDLCLEKLCKWLRQILHTMLPAMVGCPAGKYTIHWASGKLMWWYSGFLQQIL